MNENVVKSSKSRIDTIDVLRGFALVGIIYAHMIIWYTGAAVPVDVYIKYDSFSSGVAMGIFGSLVYGKFFSVFSFLFGLGFYLQLQRRKPGFNYIMRYIWRLILLFLIGVVHHTIWRGDILAIYAVLGILLLLFRNLPGKVLLLLSLILILDLPNHIYAAFNFVIEQINVALPMEEEGEKYYNLVRNGDLITVFKENWNSWPAKVNFQLQSGRLLMTFGYFLLGLYAGRSNLFYSIGNHLRLFSSWNKKSLRIIILLLLYALFLYLNDYVSLPEIRIVAQFKWITVFLFDVYNACVTIFYITGITLLFQDQKYKAYLNPLAAMGRMALTNYLLQTVFGLLIFYQFGLGLFDRTSPALNVLIAVFIIFIQINLSNWWLGIYKQGPVEWLWKSLSQFKFGPIKR